MTPCPHRIIVADGIFRCAVDHYGAGVHFGRRECRTCQAGKVPGGPPPTFRGLGDVVAAITRAVRIPSCGGCKKRQAALNKLVPFQAESKVVL